MKKALVVIFLLLSFRSQSQDIMYSKTDTVYKLYRGEYSKVISSKLVIKDTSHKAMIEAKRTRRGKILWRVLVVAWTALTTFGVIYSSK